MIDNQIQDFIASGQPRSREVMLQHSGDLIHHVRNTTRSVEEVGAIRRGEEQIHGLEILVVINTEHQTNRLRETLAKFQPDLDVSRPRAWTMTFYDIPAVIYFARSDTVVAQRIITTGPADFVAGVQQAARAKGFTLDESGFRKGSALINLIKPLDEATIMNMIGRPYVPPQGRAEFARTHCKEEEK